MTKIIYRPPNYKGPEAKNATQGVKFANQRIILDPWWIIGGTKWSRTLIRLRHPIVYSKRGLRNFYRKIKRLFIKEPPPMLLRTLKSKEEVLKLYPEKKK